MRIRNAISLAAALWLAACGGSASTGDENNNSANQNGNANGNDNTNANGNNAPECGNGQVEGAEQCDQGALNSDTAPDTCRLDCTLPRCGDGVLDTGEACDGADLGALTCGDLGYTAGALSCTTGCTFEESGCTTCGDNTAEGDDPAVPGYEPCDGADLRGATCASLGHVWGDLACVGCAVDESGCHDQPAVCGNGVREDLEECDGADLDGLTCETLGEGFTGGNLACDAGCLFSRADCAICGNGVVETGEACDDGNTAADLTCAADCASACTPGFAECNGDVSSFCAVDGSGVTVEYCDPLQGMVCNPTSGLCEGACASQILGHSYIGCDYFPTITNNALLTNKTLFHFAVAVSNSTQVAATVTVTRGANPVSTTVVAPASISIITLPWIPALSDTNATQIVTDGAYRLRSDQPVTVYQYNPLEYTNGAGVFTYTNDAALLLPVNTWTGNYRVVARNVFMGYPGLYAVTASEDNTTVVITPSATGGSVLAGAGVAANGSGTVILNAGDVLQVLASALGGSPDLSDPTGTLITADRPVQVIGGHECSFVPYSVGYCDHLEESIPPLETLGNEYLVASPAISTSNTKAFLVRVVATQPNTTLTYDPPQAGAPASIANAGDYIEMGPVNAAFQITASEDVLVVQYMLGQDAGGNTGDPAMAIAVPTRQYRTDYLFHAPTNYEANYVNVTAPTGATVTLDGVALSGWVAIGSTGFDVTRAQLSNAGNGNHTLTASEPVGISVYGYGQYTSYWYPGGLNLVD